MVESDRSKCLRKGLLFSCISHENKISCYALAMVMANKFCYRFDLLVKGHHVVQFFLTFPLRGRVQLLREQTELDST